MITLYSVNGMLSSICNYICASYAIIWFATLLLAIIYKMIPEAKVHWQDIAVASILSGMAFTVTNSIFGTYIQTFIVTTLIGTAGALVVILLWIFILNQIVLFGAELSKVYATNVGEHAKQHLPEYWERITQPFEKIGEKIERATKDEFETMKNPVKTRKIET